MSIEAYRYVIVGAGLAGAAAVKGIREHDPRGSILLFGQEGYPPYHRPPLTKDLWFGKKTIEEIFFETPDYYDANQVNLSLESEVIEVDPTLRLVIDRRGRQFQYERLLLATGGAPRRLPIPGADLEGICYYRTLNDYRQCRDIAAKGSTAVVIGGGFIGSEIAAALATQGILVTMIFPESYLASRVFSPGLGQALTEQYRRKGITIDAEDLPSSFEKRGDGYLVQTRNMHEFTADLLIVGAGIIPNTTLARQAGLAVTNGIVVNGFLQTSDPEIYAAGDNALFPYATLHEQRRVEHWDNALAQGRIAGSNMAGADMPYTYMPYFYSDLFQFGYEAVGEIDSSLEIVADWVKENETGVLYYLKDGVVRGVMLCNIWGQLDAARDLIRRGERYTPAQLRGAIMPGRQQAA